jgi:hypothetical protein
MCGTWAEYTLITSLPAFMKGVLNTIAHVLRTAMNDHNS